MVFDVATLHKKYQHPNSVIANLIARMDMMKLRVVSPINIPNIS